MTEAVLTGHIIRALNNQKETWAFKVHGGMYQAGVSDILCCYKGTFIALEVKLPGKERKLTKLQTRFLLRVRDAGGAGVLVTSVDQALEVIRGYNN